MQKIKKIEMPQLLDPVDVPWSDESEFPIINSPVGTDRVVGLFSDNNGSCEFNTIKDFVLANTPSGVHYGEMYFVGNTTPTTVTDVATPVKVNATYLSGALQDFTQSSGTLTCTATTPTTYLVIASGTATYIGSSNDTAFQIKHAGALVTKSKQEIFIGGVSPAAQAFMSVATLSLSEGDTLELWVQNDTSTDDPIIQDLNFSAIAIGASSTITPDVPGYVDFTATVDESNTSGADTINVVCGSILQSGDYAIGSFTLSFRATSLTPSISLHMPYVEGTFPISIKTSVDGNVTMDSGANAANFLAQSINLSGTDSINFPMKVASSTAPNNYYTLNASFSYKYKNF